MALNLKKNQTSLIKAYRDISEGRTTDTWVIFGYEGFSSNLRVVTSGDGGLEDVANEVNSSQVQYIYCKIKDTNTNLDKFILINWQGEGAKNEVKVRAVSHLGDLQNFLKGIHITINARTEDDLLDDEILTKVSKSHGSSFNIKKNNNNNVSKGNEIPGPVGSVYRKVNIQREISQEGRDEFWAKQEAEDKVRKEQERKKSLTDRHNYEVNRKQKDKEEREERERKQKERERVQREVKQSEKQAEQKARRASEHEEWSKTQQEVYKDDEERRKRSESLRKERAAEAAHLLSNKAGKAKAFFEQKAAENAGITQTKKVAPPPPRKVKRFQPAHPVEQPVSNEDLSDNQYASSHSQLSETEPQQKQPSYEQDSMPEHNTRYEPENRYEPPAFEPENRYEPPAFEQETRHEPPAFEPETNADLLSFEQDTKYDQSETFEPQSNYEHETQLEPQTNYEPEEIYENEPYNTHELANNEDDATFRVSAPEVDSLTEQMQAQDLMREGLPPRQMSDSETEDDSSAWNQETFHDAVESSETLGAATDTVTAYGDGAAGSGTVRALYDYQAEEDGEITFDPGDLITEIEEIDPGWWIGTAPDGSRGMFPANYVEKI